MNKWFTLAVLTVFFASCWSQVPPGCEVTTTTGYRYSVFHHLHSSPTGEMDLRFRVMAKSDAHIALTTSPLVLNPLYEIVIGASGNNYTDLRRTMTGRSVSAVKTPSLLSDSEFRGFWVSVRNGEVEVGREGETLPYFHWKDPDPLPVHYYSLSSWTNTVAKWIQKCNFPGPNSWLAPENTTTPTDEAAQASSSSSVIDFYNAEERLRTKLLQNYNKDVRPSPYHNTPVTVSLAFTLNHFELIEMTSKISIQSWIRLTWRDQRLVWNASDYENNTLVHIPSHFLWLPDITLYNNANAGEMVRLEETNALVYSDGSVLHVPPSTFESICELDLRYWPYDTQSCSFKFGSWSHGGDRIALELYDNVTELDSTNLHNNLHWELVSTSANVTVDSYEGVEETYPSVSFSLVIRRRSPLFRATIVAPGVAIALLTVIAFLLPPNAMEKVLIGLIDMLILSFYLLYFGAILPPLGDHMPFIVSFYSNMLVMVAVSIMLAVVTTVLSRTAVVQGPPYLVIDILSGWTGTLLGLGHLIPLLNKTKTDSLEEPATPRNSQYNLHVDEVQLVTPEEGRHGDPTNQPKKAVKRTFSSAISHRLDGLSRYELEWLLLAYAVDRIALVIYFFVFAVMMASAM